MKTIKYTAKAIIVILCVSLSGCDDSKFLNENPSTFYTTENIYSTSEQVDQVLISIYSYLRDIKTNTSEAAWTFNLNGKGTDMYDVANIRKGNTFSDYSTINPDHVTFREVYQAFYTIISRANMAIYASSLPQITWASEAEKAYLVGQARFFRAYAYMNLAELFGGVPIVTEIETAPRYDYVRTTRVETYQYAIEELEAILNDIPETTASGGRIIRGAVQHYLSESYLAMGTQLNEDGKSGDAQSAFANSIKYANMVIDGGFYSLMTDRFGARKEDEYFSLDIRPGGSEAADIVDTICFKTNHYWDLFQDGNVNYQDGNKECIWALQIDYNAYRAEDTKSKLNYTRAYGSIMRDNINEWIAGMLEDIGGRGITQVNITMYTRDLIYEGKFEDDLRNSDAVFRRRFKGNVIGSPYYLKDIPWEAIYNKSDENTNQVIRSAVYPLSCKIFTDRYVGLDAGENRSNLFRDDYYIRLSETILLRAEAKQRSGDKAGAAADVNLLRARANAAYLVTDGDMDDSFNMILDERARELVYEERRWNTLLRMGGTIAVDRIRKYAFWPETAATLTFNYNLWPIPQSVIDVNKDIPIEQNPGWTNR